MEQYKGKTILPNIAIGKIWFYSKVNQEIPKYHVEHVEEEIRRMYLFCFFAFFDSCAKLEVTKKEEFFVKPHTTKVACFLCVRKRTVPL